ncbi:MAG: sulfurtransferase complex subunit TusC [Pseudomonadales bacterium]
METKRLLFLLRQPPYGSSHALEALESALVAGVFDQRVSVLFSGDGVWQLLAGQDGPAIQRRSIAKIVRALPQYDVTALYACAEALATRGLGAGDLSLPVAIVTRDEQRALLAEQDAVVND